MSGTVRLVDENGRLISVMSREVYEDERHLGAALRAYIADSMDQACLTCNGSGVLVDCHGGSCSHVNDREWPCPACETAREVGDEPEETW
jgi:hypothetical protein